MEDCKLLFYPYRHEHGICYFVVIAFHSNGINGSAVAVRCQYIQNSDTLRTLNEFETLNNLMVQQQELKCIDAKIYNNLLWCSLLSGASA